jgi:hypothetical protein
LLQFCRSRSPSPAAHGLAFTTTPFADFSSARTRHDDKDESAISCTLVRFLLDESLIDIVDESRFAHVLTVTDGRDGRVEMTITRETVPEMMPVVVVRLVRHGQSARANAITVAFRSEETLVTVGAVGLEGTWTWIEEQSRT